MRSRQYSIFQYFIRTLCWYCITTLICLFHVTMYLLFLRDLTFSCLCTIGLWLTIIINDQGHISARTVHYMLQLNIHSNNVVMYLIKDVNQSVLSHQNSVLSGEKCNCNARSTLRAAQLGAGLSIAEHCWASKTNNVLTTNADPSFVLTGRRLTLFAVTRFPLT